MKKPILLISLLLFANTSDSFYYQKDKKVFLTPINKTQNRELSKIVYYKTTDNYRVGVTKELIVKIKYRETLENLLQKYSLTIKKRLTSSLYLLQADNKDKTLDIANKLHDEIGVSYAHPNFIKEMRSR